MIKGLLSDKYIPIRPLERRQMLVEVDVLVASSLGLSLPDFLKIYDDFELFEKNERGTYYDAKGDIVFSAAFGYRKAGYLNARGERPSNQEWEALLATSPSELVCMAIDDTRPGGPYEVERRFVGPFFTCDRVADYKRAWTHFEKLYSENAA